MLDTLRLMLSENWEWRKQIVNLALLDIKKTCRGAVLGWIWLLVKPLTYVLVFWFALDMGLRAGNGVEEYPFILWLCAGLIPWFFMQDMISTGANVYKRYPYLVNRIKFPLSAISTFYVLSQFIINVFLMLIMLVVCFVVGQGVSLFLLQLPVVYLVMLVFFTCFSVMISPLSAISKDFNNLLIAFGTPIFWVSGIIFDVSTLNLPLIQEILAFNPVTFFATASRACFCDPFWIWEKPELWVPFLIVFALTALMCVVSYHRLRKDVADVL